MTDAKPGPNYPPGPYESALLAHMTRVHYVLKLCGPRSQNGNCKRSYVFYSAESEVLAVADANSGGALAVVDLASRGKTLPGALCVRLQGLVYRAPVFDVKARKLRELSRLANSAFLRTCGAETAAYISRHYPTHTHM